MRSRAWLLVGSAALAMSAVPGTAAAGSYPFRDEYVKTTTQHIFDVITKDNKAVTEDERSAARDHWATAMRVIRVREVADAENDASTAARADALLKKIDATLFAKLTKLNAKAPAEASLVPPKILAPSGGQSMPLSGALAITLEPYKNATKYFCSIRQGKHEWSNMHALSTAPSCSLEATDPHHRRFKAGHAEARARVLVKGAWSNEVKVPFEITGTAPPAAQPVANDEGAPSAPTGGGALTRHTGPFRWDGKYVYDGGDGNADACPNASFTVSNGKFSIPYHLKSSSTRAKGGGAAHVDAVIGKIEGTVAEDGNAKITITIDPSAVPTEFAGFTIKSSDLSFYDKFDGEYGGRTVTGVWRGRDSDQELTCMPSWREQDFKVRARTKPLMSTSHCNSNPGAPCDQIPCCAPLTCHAAPNGILSCTK